MCSHTRCAPCAHAVRTAIVSSCFPNPAPVNSGSSPKYTISVAPSDAVRSSKYPAGAPAAHATQSDTPGVARYAAISASVHANRSRQ